MHKMIFPCCILAYNLAFCMPELAVIVSGEAQISQENALLNITTSDQVILDWNSFSIAAGETVKFSQPSSASAVLNRVTGSEMSQIMGMLQANGKVYLINPNGLIIGRDAVINTASFIASTF